jgi:EAL domain-containing protein (putative c-di-GMP-specific phosphodiesterase class I)/DNA-binding NarL/FixJ family response regulator
MRILVVDDDDHVAFVVSRAVEELATCDTVGSVRDAIHALEQEPYDLVLIDLSLPDGSGMALLDALRDSWPHTVPMMLSGISDLAVAREALAKGALGYVVKPFRVRDLRIQITAALAVADRSANASRVSARARALARLAPLLEQQDPRACVVVDLEHLPTLGASFGADAVERLCTCIEQRLHAFDPSLEVLGQLGPSSFAATLTVTAGRSPSRAAGELHRALSAPVMHDGQRIPIALRIGIVAIEPGESADVALGLAEAAADAAQNGETAFVAHDGGLDDEARMQRDLVADVAAAIHDGHLHVEYQSQWDLRTADLIGFEALARWRHPIYGDVSPAVFVPIAERLDLIGDLGAFVLRTACREVAQLRRNHSRHALRVSVNVSALELRDDVYPTVVAVALAEAGLPPSALRLEVTESVALNESDDLQRVLNGLQALGVELSVDDFGTGYSSFDNLARIAWAEIKLDRTITIQTHNARGREMMRSILSFGRALGIDVIAEGIETVAELDALRALNCRFGQGFLLGRPQTMRELAQLPVAGAWAKAPVLTGSAL